MKIINAEVFVTCPGRNFVTLKITTDAGITGLGDATLNGRELSVASYLRDHLCPQLIGRDAQRIEDIWQFFYKGAYWRRGPVTMVTVLWAYLRNPAFKKDGVDYHSSADLTGQANHIAATIGADIVKQKMAENNGGYRAVNFGYTDDRVYDQLTSDHPIDLVRYQLANCYMGRAGLINSGGAAGENDLQESVRTAVINKRAGGMGLILGRKAFKKSMKDGVALINAVQDTYLDDSVTIA